jgi:hypothetical protein
VKSHARQEIKAEVVQLFKRMWITLLKTFFPIQKENMLVPAESCYS